MNRLHENTDAPGNKYVSTQISTSNPLMNMISYSLDSEYMR